MSKIQSESEIINAEPVTSFMGPIDDNLPSINSDMVVAFVNNILDLTQEKGREIGNTINNIVSFIDSILTTTVK